MAQLSRREASIAAVVHAFELLTALAGKAVHPVASELRRRYIHSRKLRRLHDVSVHYVTSHYVTPHYVTRVCACDFAHGCNLSDNPPAGSPAFSSIMCHILPCREVIRCSRCSQPLHLAACTHRTSSVHLPLSQHAQMRCAHASNRLLFLQHFQISRRFLTQRCCSRCLLLRRCDWHSSHRHSAHHHQRCYTSAHPSILRHAHHHIARLILSPQHPKLRNSFLTGANAPML